MAPEPLLESLEDNFARAVLTLLTGRQHRGYVGSRYQEAWNAVRSALQAHDQRGDTSVEAAVLLTVDLYELLAGTFRSSGWELLEVYLVGNASLPADEVITGLGALSAEVYDPARAIPWPFVNIPEVNPAMPGPWHSFDEYDIWRNRVEPRAARVRERRWQPELPEEPFDIQLRGASPPPPVRAASGGLRRSRRWEDEGVEADMMRVHDLVASHRAGYAADDRVFFQPRGQASRLLMSIVVDQSASMRANRTPRQSELAFHRALRLAHRWANAWQRQIPIGLFGGWDTGRRSVTLHVLKDWGERYLPSRLLSLHTMGMGGFRMGAMVRYLSWRGERVAPGARHLVVMLTDSASHYLARGLDRVLAKNHPPKGCMQCNHAETCSIEPCVPRVNGSGQLEDRGLYYPTFYELADLRQALIASPQVTPALVLLDDFYDEPAVRRQLPRGDCVVIRRAEEAENVDRILQSILRGAPA